MAVRGGLAGQLFPAATVRRGLHLDALRPFLAGAVLGVPPGVHALPYLDPARFRLVLGVLLAACSAGMPPGRRLPSVARFGRAGDLVAGVALVLSAPRAGRGLPTGGGVPDGTMPVPSGH